MILWDNNYLVMIAMGCGVTLGRGSQKLLRQQGPMFFYAVTQLVGDGDAFQ